MPRSGVFTLTGDVSFGATFGLVSQYFKSSVINPASSGLIRMAKTDTIDWRNNLNNGNNALAVNSSDQLTYNGSVLIPTSGTGNLTDAGTDGIVVTGGTGAVVGSGTSLAQHVADTTHNGYLSSTDWNTFNGKQAAGNYITALTGDITASGPGSVAATLATVNSNVGTFTYPSVTVNNKGLITAISSQTPVTSITGTANEIIASSSTGAVTLSTPQAIATTSSPTFANETLTAAADVNLNITATGAHNAFVNFTANSQAMRAFLGSGIFGIQNVADAVYALYYPVGTGRVTIGEGSATQINLNASTLPGQESAPADNSFDLGASTANWRSLYLKTSLILQQTGAGTNAITIAPPASITSHTLTLPAAQGAASTVLTNNGSGTLSWTAPTGSGTVNSGTAGQIAYYATSTTAVSSLAALSYSAPILTLTAGAANTEFDITSTGAHSAILGFTANSTSYNLAATGAALTLQDVTNSHVIYTYTTGNALSFTPPVTISNGLAMNSQKITSLANGTASTDAAAFGQIFTGFQAPVQGTTTSTTTTTSSTYVNTALTASITPTSSSHRIKITVSGDDLRNTNGTNTTAQLTIKRGSTSLAGNFASLGITGIAPVSITYIDSPATTSSTTYTLAIMSTDNATTVSFNLAAGLCSMILEEIV